MPQRGHAIIAPGPAPARGAAAGIGPGPPIGPGIGIAPGIGIGPAIGIGPGIGIGPDGGAICGPMPGAVDATCGPMPGAVDAIGDPLGVCARGGIIAGAPALGEICGDIGAIGGTIIGGGIIGAGIIGAGPGAITPLLGAIVAAPGPTIVGAIGWPIIGAPCTGVPASPVPQARQNFMPGGFSPRQVGQITGNPGAACGVWNPGDATGASELPQLRQNDDPGGLSWPHIEQRIGPPQQVCRKPRRTGMGLGRFATPGASC